MEIVARFFRILTCAMTECGRFRIGKEVNKRTQN